MVSLIELPRRCILRELTGLALDTAQTHGVTYADVRFVEHREQIIGVKNGVVKALSETEGLGRPVCRQAFSNLFKFE